MQSNTLPLSSDAFRQVMGAFATGVTIVTTGSGDKIHGLTVNAFSSVSLEPILVLVCVDKQAFSHDLIIASQNFAVNILKTEQQFLAERFSNNDLDAKQRYEGVPFCSAVTGAPVLQEALAWLDCKLAAAHDGGDHTVFVGQVLAMGKGESRQPLLYFQGRYHGLKVREY